MSHSETLYAPDFPCPQTLVRARTQTVECKVYRDAAQAAVQSDAQSTYTLYRPDGTAAVDAQQVTVDGDGTATYSVTSTVLDALEPLGPGWFEKWDLLMADGIVHTFPRDAQLSLYRLYPVVSHNTIVSRFPALSSSFGSQVSSLQPWLDAAWYGIIRDLHRQGILADRIVTPHSLYDLLFHRTLRDFFEASYRRQPSHQQLWEEHKGAARSAALQLGFKVDEDEDGLPDSSVEMRANTGGVVQLGGVPPQVRLTDSWRW